MVVGRDGVTRQTSYSENLYRNGTNFYIRNMPAVITTTYPIKIVMMSVILILHSLPN
jgi:hypothetical protein